jgi:phosphohistidine phosphatase SixA
MITKATHPPKPVAGAALRVAIGLFLAFHWLSPHAAEPSDRSLVDALRDGGFNIYVRHAATDWSQQDLVSEHGDWLSCNGAEIRQLSDQGRKTAKALGAALRRLQIPVSEVLASPYCRTMETARLLQLGEVQPSNAVINMRVASYFGGPDAVIESARRLLGSAPRGQGNRVVVAHGNVARLATPVYPGEAESVVFRPDGSGRFDVVARLTPARWSALAASAGDALPMRD